MIEDGEFILWTAQSWIAVSPKRKPCNLEEIMQLRFFTLTFMQNKGPFLLVILFVPSWRQLCVSQIFSYSGTLCFMSVIHIIVIYGSMLFVDTVVFYTDFKSIWDVPTSAVWSVLCVSFVPQNVQVAKRKSSKVSPSWLQKNSGMSAASSAKPVESS